MLGKGRRGVLKWLGLGHNLFQVGFPSQYFAQDLLQFFVHVNPFHAQDLLLDHCVAADRTDRSQDWNLMGVVLWVDVFARSFTAVVPLSVNFVERSNRPNSFSFKHVFSFFYRLLVESGRWHLIVSVLGSGVSMCRGH